MRRLACAAALAACLAAGTALAAPDVDALRAQIHTDRRGLVEKNMELTAEEGKKFWPIYDEQQRALERVLRRQNRAVLDYIAAEGTLTNANAKRLVGELLAADAEEQRLRERGMRKVLGILPARKAARYFQIENKIRALNRYDIAEHIPLAQ